MPRLAADLYLEHCEKKGFAPAYNIEGIVDHPNYYKLLADFSLYDSLGNYAPHQKVEYNMPYQVPYLDENGHKRWMKSETYIRNELEKELKVRDDIAEKLADKSEAGLIPRFIKAVNGEQVVEANEMVEDDTRYSFTPKKDVDNYTEEQYNDFGWVRANNVISAGYWKNFTENFADAVANNYKFPKNKNGEFMIEVYDAYDSSGITDVIVFASGTIESPNVSKIVKIDLTQETDIEDKRRELYEAERRGIQQKAGEFFRLYDKADFLRKRGNQGNSIKSVGDNNGLNPKRSRSEAKANRIVEFHIDEESGTITTTYANGEVITEKLSEKETSYSYTPKAESKEELLKQYEDGVLTREEYLDLISGKTPKSDPVSLANMHPEDYDMNTTPDIKRKTGKATGDGERRTYTTLQKSSIFDQRFKDEVKTDEFIKRYSTITNEDTLLEAARELDEGGHDGVQEWLSLPPERASTVDIVKGFILLDRYQRAGNAEGALCALLFYKNLLFFLAVCDIITTECKLYLPL